jgi:hypothetical protein
VYVNLISQGLAVLTLHLSYLEDLHIGASCQPPHDLLDSTSILFITNKFRTDQDRLMLSGAVPFAIFKPALRGQKDENQDNNAQYVPLPRVSGVIPEKQFFQKVQQMKLKSFATNKLSSNSQAKGDQ